MKKAQNKTNQNAKNCGSNSQKAKKSNSNAKDCE